MTDWRRWGRQDKDSAERKRENVAKIHAWNCVTPPCGQNVWRDDNDQCQHLHDQPTESKVGTEGPCHARSRKHEVSDQARDRHGTKEPVINLRRILKNQHQHQHGQNRPEQDILDPPFPIIRKKRKDEQNIKNCDRRHDCQPLGARRTMILGIRLPRTTIELWHSGATLSVLKYSIGYSHRSHWQPRDGPNQSKRSTVDRRSCRPLRDVLEILN